MCSNFKVLVLLGGHNLDIRIRGLPFLALQTRPASWPTSFKVLAGDARLMFPYKTRIGHVTACPLS
jgi:hypothetical protein